MSNAAEHALRLSRWVHNMKAELIVVKTLLAEIEIERETNQSNSNVSLLDLLEKIDDNLTTNESLDGNYRSTEKLVEKESSELINQMTVLHKIFNQFKTNFDINSSENNF